MMKVFQATQISLSNRRPVHKPSWFTAISFFLSLLLLSEHVMILLHILFYIIYDCKFSFDLRCVIMPLCRVGRACSTDWSLPLASVARKQRVQTGTWVVSIGLTREVAVSPSVWQPQGRN